MNKGQFVLIVAAGSSILLSRAEAENRSTPTFETMAAVAKDICARPTMYGYTRVREGAVDGKLSLSGLFRKLLNVGVKAEGKDTKTNWEGVLQADAAKALAQSNDCARDMFKTMVLSLNTLPDKSPQNARESRPPKASGTSPVRRQSPAGQSFVANGPGPIFSPPKLNARTLDGCMITPEKPAGDGCSVQDTQTIAARFCEKAGYLSSETFSTADTGKFQASYKLSKKVAGDGQWHFVWNVDDAGGFIVSRVVCRK